MKNLSPDTKIADLTVGEFEEVMTRVLCRAAEYLAVRSAQEAHFLNIEPPLSKNTVNFLEIRRQQIQDAQKQISGEKWPSSDLPVIKSDY